MSFKSGAIETTPMMLVPVFIVMLAFFGVMAVRNEMLKDDIREIKAEVEVKEKTLVRVREEGIEKLAAAEISKTSLSSHRYDAMLRQKDETRKLRQKREELVTEAGTATGTTAALEVEVEALRADRIRLQEELTQVRRAENRPDAPAPPPEVAPDPLTEIFSAAEADSLIVLRKYGLAITNIKIYPVAQEIVAELLYLIDTPAYFERQVDAYYSTLWQIDSTASYSDRYKFYLQAQETHEDLREVRVERLKSLKAAITELEEIVRDTQKEVKAGNFDRDYISIYIPLLEAHRKQLRKIECKPPAEPKQRMEKR